MTQIYADFSLLGSLDGIWYTVEVLAGLSHGKVALTSRGG
jgi:hypothetical protein